MPIYWGNRSAILKKNAWRAPLCPYIRLAHTTCSNRDVCSMPINASYRCSWEWCFKKAVVFFKQFFGTFMGALMWAELRGLLWAAVAPNILPMATVYGVMRCATLHLDCVLAPWGCATLTPGCILALLQGTRCRDDRNHGVALR